MNRTEQNALDEIAGHLADTDPDLADLLTETSSDTDRPATSALATATIGLVVLVVGLVVSSSVLTVLGLSVMIILPGPVACGAFSAIRRLLARHYQ